MDVTNRNHRRRKRWLVAVLLTFPLLQTGTCLQILGRSLANGFFDGTVPFLDAQFADLLERVDFTAGENTEP